MIAHDTDIQAALAWRRGRREGVPKSRLCDLLLNPHRFGGSAGGGSDPDFANVQLLLHGDGSAGSTVMTDSSSFARAVTAVGNAQIGAHANALGGTAVLLDGDGDYLSVGAAADWSWMHAPNAKWSVEMRIKPDDFAREHNLFSTSAGSTANSGIYCALGTSRQILFQMYRGVVSSTVIDYSTIAGVHPTNTSVFTTLLFTWDHTLAAGNFKVFVNGTLVGTGNKSANAPSSSAASQPLRIGTLGFPASDLKGMTEEVRVTKDVIRQTGDYSIATGPFPNSA